MLYPSHTSLEARTVIRGRNTYHPPTQGRKTSLSLNCMFNGRGVYETDEARFAVDDRVFLLLNRGRDYVFGINSDTAVESLSICFPDAYLDQALTALMRRDDDLLDDPGSPPLGGNEFFETLYSADRSLDLSIRRLHRALDAGPLTEPDLGERLRLLAAALLRSVLRLERQADSIDAQRLSTRQELVRRLHRGKDYIHAHLGRDLPLQEIAAAAALSPHHFLRSFRAVFGLTPHAYLIEQRLAQARTLLERTDLPVLAVCLRVGFGSGIDHMRSIFAPMFEAGEVRVEVLQQLVSDAYVVNEEIVTYPDDRGRTRYVSIYEVRDGKIKSVRFVRDAP